MVEIKKMIKKTGHYPVKDPKTGRISLIRPKKGVETKEKLGQAIDSFYYENDIEHRNPKNWNPPPRRPRGLQPAEHRAPVSRKENYSNGGEDDGGDSDDSDDHVASRSESQEPHEEMNPQTHAAHAEPAYFDLDSAESSSSSQHSQSAPHSPEELENGVRNMSFRTNPLRRASEEISGRRRPHRSHAIDQVQQHSTRPLKPQASTYGIVYNARNLPRHAQYRPYHDAIHGAEDELSRYPPVGLKTSPRHHSDSSRSGAARSPTEDRGQAFSATLERQRRFQPAPKSTGDLSRESYLVERDLVWAKASGRPPQQTSKRTGSFYVKTKSTQPLRQAEAEHLTRQGLK